jgi:hypothetical protein
MGEERDPAVRIVDYDPAWRQEAARLHPEDRIAHMAAKGGSCWSWSGGRSPGLHGPDRCVDPDLFDADASEL